MSKKIMIVNGNPKQESFVKEMAVRYQRGAESSGAEVRFLDISTMEFDPDLHVGYDDDQPLEPDLVEVRDAVEWADHLVFAYPTWWGSMPAKLKGLFDRVFLPGFAFKYEKGKPFWKKLLKGRSGEVLITMDAPPLWNRLINGNPQQKQVKRTILKFCGLKPVKLRSFGSMKMSDEKKRCKWLEDAERYGSKAAR